MNRVLAVHADRKPSRQAYLIVLGTLCVLAAPHLGLPMFLYPIFGLGLCTVMLRYRRLGWADVGFRWRAFGIVPLIVGGALGVIYAAINYSVIGPALFRLLGERPDLTDFAFVRDHLSGYVIALVMAWLIGGFYEELVFRGFLHDAFLRHLRVSSFRPLLAFALTALIFAAYHWQLGRFGVANALVFALFAAAIRSRWPANLWYVISFHACADMSAFTLMRLGYL
ncbi:CPBP family intramembrane glutamic endopeptidase [Dyella marensis]|uniref:CAAX protease self-immunity n=1 Tax=Dyella marensis TaxID=500610 RepID=A0A1I2K0D3_9GAMM|nr:MULTISPECIES: CPBP family intramembrane glutamic endopeptidase [Dyella]SFF60294.1 CAAX protease self-immunity [Dyella marensis]